MSMKIAVPVTDAGLSIYGNAGHAPFFAIFEIKGGMFKSFVLERLVPNPRTDVEHADCGGEHGHSCTHDEGDDAPLVQHDLMGSALAACTYLVVKKACKNTMLGMTRSGVKVIRYPGSRDKAPAALAEMTSVLV